MAVDVTRDPDPPDLTARALLERVDLVAGAGIPRVIHGIEVRVDPAMPEDEIRFEADGRPVGRITGLG